MYFVNALLLVVASILETLSLSFCYVLFHYYIYTRTTFEFLITSRPIGLILVHVSTGVAVAVVRLRVQLDNTTSVGYDASHLFILEH